MHVLDTRGFHKAQEAKREQIMALLPAVEAERHVCTSQRNMHMGGCGGGGFRVNNVDTVSLRGKAGGAAESPGGRRSTGIRAQAFLAACSREGSYGMQL